MHAYTQKGSSTACRMRAHLTHGLVVKQRYPEDTHTHAHTPTHTHANTPTHTHTQANTPTHTKESQTHAYTTQHDIISCVKSSIKLPPASFKNKESLKRMPT